VPTTEEERDMKRGRPKASWWCRQARERRWSAFEEPQDSSGVGLSRADHPALCNRAGQWRGSGEASNHAADGWEMADALRREATRRNPRRDLLPVVRTV